MRQEGLRDAEWDVVQEYGEELGEDCREGYGRECRVAAAEGGVEACEGVGWGGEEECAGVLGGSGEEEVGT